MKKILVVIGSAREGRAADKVAKLVADELTALGAEPTMADLQKIGMPFFNNATAPASETYVPTEPSVIAWSNMVKESDAVVLLTPEYNHGTSAILKNAIDSLGSSMTHLKAVMQEDTASLFFMKSIGLDGEAMGDEAKTMIQPLMKTLVG
jgi:NAD(P)H-dependent FMN reductase